MSLKKDATQARDVCISESSGTANKASSSDSSSRANYNKFMYNLSNVSNEEGKEDDKTCTVVDMENDMYIASSSYKSKSVVSRLVPTVILTKRCGIAITGRRVHQASTTTWLRARLLTLVLSSTPYIWV